jgi:hypothetical protein
VEEADQIRKALFKKALGYSENEIIEEYSVDEDGKTSLAKKKVTKKHYAPDISAVKLLLEKYYKTYEEKVIEFSDGQLLKEKQQLEKLLKGEKNGDL